MLCVTFGLYACQTADDRLSTGVETPQTSVDEQTDLTLIPREDIVLTGGEQAVVAGNNVIAFDLLISPLSLSLALAMLNNGAGGATQEEIQQALGGSDLTRKDVNGYFRKMVSAMQELDLTTRFESANSIWAQEKFPILDTFKDVNRTYFDAEARNFSDAANAILWINEWCNEKTHGLIPELLDEASHADVYLLNVLCFKGYWTNPFDRSLTEDAAFANQNGTKQQLPMMRFKNSIPASYMKSETFEMVELPYGNEAFVMTLLLPAEGISVASVVEELDAPAWEESVSWMYVQTVDVRLPRFKADYTRELSKDLKVPGMTSMFGNTEFPLLSPTPLVVSFVLQKTAIEVAEAGTEAAAATVIKTEGASDELVVIPVLEFNRPFIYFIREKSTGSILFGGIIRNL
jgi:serpin B